MALIEAKNLRVRSEAPVTVYEWRLKAGDNAIPIEVNPCAVCAVQVKGRFDGGYVEMLGSLDGETFGSVRDNFGVVMSVHGPMIRTFADAVRFVKPDNATGVDGEVVVTVMLGGPK